MMFHAVAPRNQKFAPVTPCSVRCKHIANVPKREPLDEGFAGAAV
jgi:hypothetical protein